MVWKLPSSMMICMGVSLAISSSLKAFRGSGNDFYPKENFERTTRCSGNRVFA